jgi:hypothetical protein
MSEKCTNCGGIVSNQFAKVHGDNDDKIHRCYECIQDDFSGRRAIKYGAAAINDVEEIKKRMRTENI